MQDSNEKVSFYSSMPFDMPVPDGFILHNDMIAGESFANYCKNQNAIIKQLAEWFEKFPNCCDKHKGLDKETWFKKSDYNNIVDKILDNLFYTEHIIRTSIGQELWYESITEYINDCLVSFGEFSPSYYGNCGGDQYHKFIKYWIKDHTVFNEMNNEKRESLLSFLSLYNSDGIPLNNQYKERYWEWSDFISSITGSNNQIITEFQGQFKNKLKATFDVQKSRYTDIDYINFPQIKDLDSIARINTNEITSSINLQWFIDNGSLDDKEKVLSELSLHIHTIGKVNYPYDDAMQEVRDLIYNWIVELHSLIKELSIIPKSTPIIIEPNINKVGRPAGVNEERNNRICEKYTEYARTKTPSESITYLSYDFKKEFNTDDLENLKRSIRRIVKHLTDNN